jgi:hypothetical protein
MTDRLPPETRARLDRARDVRRRVLAYAPTDRPRTVSFRAAPCRCCRHHEPEPVMCERHHVQPLYLDGPETGELVPLCSTGHEIVHALLREWAKARAAPEGPPYPHRGNRYLFVVAREGWRRAHGLSHQPLPR